MAEKISRENGKKGGGPTSSKTLIAQQIKERMAEKRMDPIIDAMLDKAEGRLSEVSTKDGNVYQKGHLPDSLAFKTILEHVLGRPRQSVEGTGVNKEDFITDEHKEYLEKLAKEFDRFLESKELSAFSKQ